MRAQKFILFFLVSIGLAHSGLSSASEIYLSAEENRFLETINLFRSALGLPTVQIHFSLESAAKKHSSWMASQDFLTHFGPMTTTSPFDRMAQEGYPRYTFAGENVACGNGDPIKAFRQFAFSPSHLETMLNPHYHHAGIARAGTGNEKCPYYWTIDFGSLTDGNMDPAEVHDLNAITQAVIRASGAVPVDKIRLPSDQPQAISNPKLPHSVMILCSIPYSIGKGIFTQTIGAETLLEASADLSSSRVQLTFAVHGKKTVQAPILLSGARVIANAEYQVYVIISGNFILQYNTTSGVGQFDSLTSSNGLNHGLNHSVGVSCSLKSA